MREGDWVITTAIVHGRKIKAISYIIEERPDCYITVGAKKYQGLVFVSHKKNIKPMKNSLSRDDIDELIDMALARKDKKWFNRLCKMKKEAEMKK